MDAVEIGAGVRRPHPEQGISDAYERLLKEEARFFAVVQTEPSIIETAIQAQEE